MSRFLLGAVPCLLLAGCSATRSGPEHHQARRGDCHIEVVARAESAGELVLTLQLPPEATAGAHELTTLVGNALVTLPLDAGSCGARRDFLELTWDARARRVRATTPGKALELRVALALAPGTSPGDLVLALERGAEVSQDGRELDGLRLRAVSHANRP